MNEVPLTLAISDYDHVRDLASGKVRVEGVALTCLDLTIPEIRGSLLVRFSIPPRRSYT